MKCLQCAKTMNPVQVLLGPVCLECTWENHKRIIGKKRRG